jgi:stress-induced morphogen
MQGLADTSHMQGWVEQRKGKIMAGRIDRLRAAIEQEFAPDRLEIADESARHAGHAGVRGTQGGETHYAMLVVSQAFKGQSRVQRSRRVHEVLAAEFSGGLHALSLSLRTPEEAAAENPPAGQLTG